MPRKRQCAIAASVVMLHILAIQSLMIWWKSAHEQAADSLTWVPLAASKSTTVAPLGSIETPQPQLNFPIALSAPSMPSIVIAPDENTNQAVLRDLVTCALPENGKIWTEERERCQGITKGVRTFAVAKHVPTTAEEKLARKFKRAKAIQDAPLTAPCFNGASFSVICLVNGFTEGFDHVNDE